MNEVQLLAAAGVGGFIAVILVRWLIGTHIPSLIKAFQSENQKERECHTANVNRMCLEIKDLGEGLRKGLSDLRSDVVKR